MALQRGPDCFYTRVSWAFRFRDNLRRHVLIKNNYVINEANINCIDLSRLLCFEVSIPSPYSKKCPYKIYSFITVVVACVGMFWHV